MQVRKNKKKQLVLLAATLLLSLFTFSASSISSSRSVNQITKTELRVNVKNLKGAFPFKHLKKRKHFNAFLRGDIDLSIFLFTTLAKGAFHQNQIQVLGFKKADAFLKFIPARSNLEILFYQG